MASSASTGYLLIGDISGYTSYVAATEIEHSQAVLAELLELLIHRTSPMLTLSKLEGDAIFCYAPRERVTRGESMLEMIEATYAAFRSRVESIQRHTTCECNACRMIPRLDLKFMVHFGQYIQQKVANISELLGSDVNLVHRLTKNDISKATGWNAYALFSEAAVKELHLEVEGLHQQAAAYEHLGEIQTYSLNLRARYDEMLKNREVVVRPEEAHGQFSIEFSAPPPVVWEWLSDPHKRNLWQPKNTWNAANRPGGRTAVGATNHCHHGKDAVAIEVIRDWRPFDYFTIEAQVKPGGQSLLDNLETVKLEPLNGGQRTRMTSRVHILRAGILSRVMARIMYGMMKNDYLLLADLLEREKAGLPEVPALEDSPA